MIPRLAAVCAALVFLVACSGGGTSGSSGAPAAGASSGARADWFSETAKASGLDFTHFNGMSGQLFYPEIMAPGVGLLDYDNDGDLDVYVVQGQMLGAGKTIKDATYPPAGPLRDHLFRNDLTVGADGTRTLHFTDVTDASHIDIRTFGMGVATGDIDNDGWIDIYRTSLSGSVMLHNNGDGTFTDVTKSSGTGDPGAWGVSAAFGDIDRDGWLDLFVGNYLIYDTAGDVKCLSVTGQRDYCPPNSYRAKPSRLYHNAGKGSFIDVTSRALIGGAYGPALGVVMADFNRDGWQDIYVGNDGVANQLWINQHDSTFKDTALLSGAAVNAAGNAEASMGIGADDFDNDGDDDLFITNWMAQMNILYVNDGSGAFEDRKGASGLGPPSLAKTGFGTNWIDYDNDSWLDLLVINGSVAMIEAQAQAKDPFPLRMAKQLYRNLGNGRFEDVSPQAGAAFKTLDVGRGAAFGDIDNDGDTDAVVGNAAGPLQLLINNPPSPSGFGGTSLNHWLGVRAVGPDGKRDQLGARIEVPRANGPTLWRRLHTDGSYASANDPRVLIGLGGATDVPRVRVHWPSGKAEEFTVAGIDRYVTLVEGSGK